MSDRHIFHFLTFALLFVETRMVDVEVVLIASHQAVDTPSGAKVCSRLWVFSRSSRACYVA
jgi:hypothetical protein